MTYTYEPEVGDIVFCNVCHLAQFPSDAPSAKLALREAKAAGWKRRVVKREEHGHLWRDTEDVCPDCQKKEAADRGEKT